MRRYINPIVGGTKIQERLASPSLMLLSQQGSEIKSMSQLKRRSPKRPAILREKYMRQTNDIDYRHLKKNHQFQNKGS
jgi:hypothetical protein